MRDVGLSPIARAMRRLRWLVRRQSIETAMDDEMRYHVECEVADRVARGVSEGEARRTAMRDFGSVEAFKDAGRDARGLTWVDDVGRDLHYATRVLRRQPGFTLAVVVTFALGIGCTSAIFSLVNGVLLRPLPYSAPKKLVALWERNDARKSGPNVVSVETFEAWRARARSFDEIAALVPSNVTLDGEPAERIKGAEVSPSFFRLLGVHPRIGRDFEAGDESSGSARVVMLSDGFWRTHYGSDRGVVGRVISLDGLPATIIGVMPADFNPPRFGWMMEQPLWMPFVPSAGNRSWGRVLHVVARLRNGVDIEQANSEMAAVSTGLARERPEHDAGWSSLAVPLADQISGQLRTPLLILFAAVALLLAMSAVNVASLVTAFVRGRAHELVVRRTIGATAGRLARQLLMQCAVLGGIGTVAGIGLAIACTRGIVAFAPASVPRLEEVRIDTDVVVFAAFIATLTTIAFGLLAVRRAVRGSSDSVSGSSLGASRTTTARRSGTSIITAEIAIGVVVTLSATLMVRSFAKLRAVDLGFETSSVVAGRVSLPDAAYDTDARRDAFFDALIAKVRALPGVQGASLTTSRPLACCAPSTAVRDPLSSTAMAVAPIADVRFVDDALFSVLHIAQLGGSVFGPDEPRDGPVRVVVSKALARTIWGDADPIGRTLSIKLFGTTNARVIGVVGDVHLAGARTPVRPTAYLSTRRYSNSERDIVVRGSVEPAVLISAMRSALATLDAKVPLVAPTTLDASVATTLAEDQFTTLLLSAFALLALILASVGVYGVLSADVRRRRKEIGVRLALGAGAGGVVRLILGEALRPALVGAVIGLGAALVTARSMASLVFGIGAWDPLSFIGVTLGLLGVAAAATVMPAVRATRVSPVEAIRAD
jgi:putative ABC transport system permease protein